MCLVSRRWRGHREPESKGRPDATSEKSTIRMSNAAGPKRAKDVVGLGDHRPTFRKLCHYGFRRGRR
jgi:hypothetical protein